LQCYVSREARRRLEAHSMRIGFCFEQRWYAPPPPPMGIQTFLYWVLILARVLFQANFYRHVNPTNVGKLDEFLSRYAGREAQLVSDIEMSIRSSWPPTSPGRR
jgi:hypothetical protein